ncbi:homocysteine S-methyltransferase [Sulfurospirillum cavolei]|uniref:homocysteine S-methyltransferase n=1 Tax=Sulfurospirillum cavolei TaxID=366522 RepID=UPI0005A7E845|nr:homocysteine S-methyltransferase [Sulfurospirillum cavolei]
MNPIEPFLKKQNVLILDGAFGTELERQGYDINDPLWSATFLMHNPRAVAKVHEDYLKAGADCVTSASYQATFEGFMKRGVSREEAKRLIQSSVRITQETVASFWADESNRKGRLKPLVAASVGPYGAYLADGSEFRGNYGLSQEMLEAFHADRMEALIEAKPDLLACETIPCLLEAKALASLLKAYPNVYAWISFSAKDGKHINSGESIQECAKVLDTCDNIVAIGINCTAPQYIEALIEQIRAVTQKPIIVYPNGGATYNALSKTWDGVSQSGMHAKMAYTWYQKGANIIGGCCQTTPEDIAQIARWVKYEGEKDGRIAQ